MPMDPYAALQALLRAEAARTAPHEPARRPASAEQDEDHHRQRDPQQHQHSSDA
ncbi:hypothetical protein ACH4D5_13320 [Streptomyces sp. NPDC018029]|uniref:hypothetical protein n=1 Tax=Streptomyces sp. NPDC018029 TaxID=3365032 RepID=UPI00378EF947